jgi:cysteine desulfurase
MATHQIVGMGTAYRLARECQEREVPRLRALCERLWARLRELEDVYLNGEAAPRAPHILSVSFAGVDGEALRAGVDAIAVSGGAACSAGTAEASYVLRALGRDDALAGATLRFSVGRATTGAEIDRAAALVSDEVRRLRALAPAPPHGIRRAPGGAHA